MVPEGQGIAQVYVIYPPVFFFLFQGFRIGNGLPPLAQVHVELFQFPHGSKPGDDFFLFDRLVFIQLRLKGLFLVVEHVHPVHELVPLFLAVGREHGDLFRQVQLPLHIGRPLVVIPGAQPLFQTLVLFLVLFQFPFQLGHVLFQFFLLMLEIGKFLFLVGKGIQGLIGFFQVRHELVDLPFALGGGREKLSLGILDFCFHIGQLVAALEHEEPASYGVVGQERSALEVFQSHRKNLLAHVAVQSMPPDGRQFLFHLHVVLVFKPLFLFIPVDPVEFSVGTDKSHISFPSLPFSPAVSEKHIPDKAEHGGLAALIFSHHHVQGCL